MVLQEVEGNDKDGRNKGPYQKIDRAETGVFSKHTPTLTACPAPFNSDQISNYNSAPVGHCSSLI